MKIRWWWVMVAALALVIGCRGSGAEDQAPAGSAVPSPASASGAGATAGAGGGEGASLQGTVWRLEDLAGAGLAPDTEATLEFPAEEGKVAGNGSCNRFFGSVDLTGATIKFGQMGSTRMACPEPIAGQETRYLKALESAERFTSDGATLLIYCAGMEKPLRFVRKEP